jgi:hypothetical protein
MVMALYLMAYLYHTKQIPLVLGGNYPISVHTYTDSSLGTGPKGRSISGHMSRLNPASGSIHAKSTASTLVSMSSRNRSRRAWNRYLSFTVVLGQ